MPEYEKQQPVLKEIVDGIQSKKSKEDKEEDEEEAEKHEPTDVAYLKDKQGVPDFWAKAIEGHPMLMQIVTDKDKPIIQHCTRVVAEKAEEPSPMITIEMFFSDNEYFTNSSLKFTTREQKDGGRTEEIIGQAIDWKEGKDVTKKKIKKKQKNKKTKETRTITKTVPDESFFNVFESKKMPEDFDEKEADDEDSE